jgi:urease accessory protein
MMLETLLRVLQFSDGLFPAGGYAHSFGLETFVEDGRAATAADIRQLLHAYLEGSAGPTDAVFAVNALRRSLVNDLVGCRELDLELEAIKISAEGRAASRQFGHQTLGIAAALIDEPLVRAYSQMVTANEVPGHHAVVFGIVGGSWGWPENATAAALLYTSAVAIALAATRLMPVGQTQAQCLIGEIIPSIAVLAEDATRTPVSAAFTFAPALEIATMSHAQLDARLFKS